MKLLVKETQTWKQLFLGEIELPRVPCVGEGITFEPGYPRIVLNVVWVLFIPTEYDVLMIVNRL